MGEHVQGSAFTLYPKANELSTDKRVSLQGQTNARWPRIPAPSQSVRHMAAATWAIKSRHQSNLNQEEFA